MVVNPFTVNLVNRALLGTCCSENLYYGKNLRFYHSFPVGFIVYKGPGKYQYRQ